MHILIYRTDAINQNIKFFSSFGVIFLLFHAAILFFLHSDLSPTIKKTAIRIKAARKKERKIKGRKRHETKGKEKKKKRKRTKLLTETETIKILPNWLRATCTGSDLFQPSNNRNMSTIASLLTLSIFSHLSLPD